MSLLPIIDISSWISPSSGDIKREETTLRWNESMRDYGFAVIVGHGIDKAVFESVNLDARNFFDRPDKMMYSRESYGHPLGGYTPAGKENVEMSFDENSKASSGLKKHTDPVENFVFTSPPVHFVAPDGSVGSPIVSADEYYTSMNQLLSTIHRISASSLNLPDLDYINKFYDKTFPGNENKGSDGNCLRLANYFSQKISIPKVINHQTDVIVGDNEIRYGAHTDFQGFTILRPDKNDWHSRIIHNSEGVEVTLTAGGLEVFNRTTNEWVAVKIPSHLNTLVVNAGDLIQRWTNDYWVSPIHRVVAKPTITNVSLTSSSTTDDESDSASILIELPSRQSIVFFSGPLEQSIIEVFPLSHILNHRHGEVYPPIKSGDWLQMKLNKINT